MVQKKDKCIRWRLSKIEEEIMNFYYWKKNYCVGLFISCMYTPHVQGTEGKKENIINAPTPRLSRIGFRDSNYV